jgi:hypothetical protein
VPTSSRFDLTVSPRAPSLPISCWSKPDHDDSPDAVSLAFGIEVTMTGEDGSAER